MTGKPSDFSEGLLCDTSFYEIIYRKNTEKRIKNMIQNTPPLGWNTWNTFGPDVSDSLLRETADFLVDAGLAEAGYRYVVIDDGWSEKVRDSAGRLIPDRKKFPNGIKPVIDYIHSKGLKFGIYSCCGNLTCGAYPGSYAHEYIDAETFAEWGVDYLKYDFCYHTGMLAGKYFYRRMGAALANCGRDIVFSACSWGMEETQEWVKTTGAHLWRSTHDIQNSWASIKSIIEQQARLIPYVSRGCFNDMDMLVVGMNSDSFIDSERGTNGCTLTEQRTHFSAWCLFASPLMIGCDLRRASPEALEILKNREALAINQDSACNQVYRIALDRGPDEMPVFVRLLENGDFAVGVFNMGEGAYRFVFGLDEMGISPESGRVLIPREVWSGERPVLHNGVFDVTVESHGCRLYLCRLAKQA